MALTGGATRLDGPVVADDLDRAVELLAVAERARCAAAALLGPLEETGLARWLGYVSLQRLVAHRTGCSNRTAAELLGVARHLDRFPSTATALQTGRISWAGAEILTRTAEGLAGPYTADETELLTAAQDREPADLERICRLWRARADTDANTADAERTFERRSVRMQFAFDGSCHGTFTLDPIGAETVWTALDSPPDPATTLPQPRTATQRRADRLVDVCQHSLTDSPTGGTRATIDVIIDLETLTGTHAPLDRVRAELEHGGPITGPGLDRLLCDASYRALITAGPRVVLAYNRATPDIPPALRQAIRLRDRHCTFAGCDRPAHWCDLHHLVPRNRGGPTTADNLTLLCRFHHTCIHEGRWQLTRAPNGTITTTSP